MRQLRPVVVALMLVLAGSAHETYQLRVGDTLSGVAKRLGVSLADLAAANGITNPDRVLAGRVLMVPRGKPAPPTPAPAPAAPPPVFVAGGATTVDHVVRPGDTLARLAAARGTTVGRLAEVNGLRNPNLIRIGQRLALPGTGWVCPVQGPTRRYVDDFGYLRSGNRSHEGNDIFADRGTPVVASVGGVVKRVQGPTAGLAYYLHGDDGHVYYGAHLHTYAGAPGRVGAGAPIGTVGTSGTAQGTRPHLHFEVHPHGGPPVSPFATLKKWCG